MTTLVTGVDFVCVPAQDFAASEHFYGTVLGLPFVKQWGEMPAKEYQAGNLTLATGAGDGDIILEGIEAGRVDHEVIGMPSLGLPIPDGHEPLWPDRGRRVQHLRREVRSPLRSRRRPTDQLAGGADLGDVHRRGGKGWRATSRDVRLLRRAAELEEDRKPQIR